MPQNFYSNLILLALERTDGDRTLFSRALLDADFGLWAEISIQQGAGAYPMLIFGLKILGWLGLTDDQVYYPNADTACKAIDGSSSFAELNPFQDRRRGCRTPKTFQINLVLLTIVYPGGNQTILPETKS